MMLDFNTCPSHVPVCSSGFVDEDGEEEGVMEMGVSVNDSDTLTYIPGKWMPLLWRDYSDQLALGVGNCFFIGLGRG